MTTPNNTVNDADVVFGSLPLTIGQTGSTQVFETTDFKLAPDLKEMERTSSKNIVTGYVGQWVNRKGTATLIRSSSSVVKPLIGDPFTVTIDAISYTCFVTHVDDARTQAGQAFIPIQFRVAVGTVVSSVAT